jgi:hypothetical protein
VVTIAVDDASVTAVNTMLRMKHAVQSDHMGTIGDSQKVSSVDRISQARLTDSIYPSNNRKVEW